MEEGRPGYSTSALVRRGWPRSLITRLLGDPDEEEANPYYTHGLPMQLYYFARVHRTEASEEFKSAQAMLADRRARRRAA
jgi:hypothetical protein